MMRLVQLFDGRERSVAMVEEPRLRIVDKFRSVYALALAAIDGQISLAEVVKSHLSKQAIEYDMAYFGGRQWKLLPPLDHPGVPSRCLVSGTGLTHLGSAKNRNAMHGADAAEMTDSMKMFRAGVEGGRPAAGKIGAVPEWFYKGTGSMLQSPGEALCIPNYAEDGGEEAEIAGLYVIDLDGRPWRVGMAQGNEFSDHRFEKKNYLNLAGSKLRQCAGAGIGGGAGLHASLRGSENRARVGSDLVQNDRVGRGGDVPQPGEHRAPSFQIRLPPAAGGCAYSLFWRRFAQLRRRDRTG